MLAALSSNSLADFKFMVLKHVLTVVGVLMHLI